VVVGSLEERALHQISAAHGRWLDLTASHVVFSGSHQVGQRFFLATAASHTTTMITLAFLRNVPNQLTNRQNFEVVLCAVVDGRFGAHTFSDPQVCYLPIPRSAVA